MLDEITVYDAHAIASFQRSHAAILPRMKKPAMRGGLLSSLGERAIRSLRNLIRPSTSIRQRRARYISRDGCEVVRVFDAINMRQIAFGVGVTMVTTIRPISSCANLTDGKKCGESSAVTKVRYVYNRLPSISSGKTI